MSVTFIDGHWSLEVVRDPSGRVRLDLRSAGELVACPSFSEHQAEGIATQITEAIGGQHD